jgi:16S rRNA G966 N2-methylase RsmD
MIEQYLNVRNSTRSLTDDQFEKIVSTLAQELEQVSYFPQYSYNELNEDWKKLKKWTSSDVVINSTSRLGMKLSEHFCPNFFDIETAKGDSFASLWNAKNLEKILRWNRKSHSTPYLSELKRGIYFCCGLPKSTMYRPQMMKLACMRYSPNTVLDPCAGWGGRMLGAVSYGADYIAFEPNTKTYTNLNKIVDFLDISHKVKLICDDVRNYQKYDLPNVDMVLTSPPYFDLEVYTHEATQSVSNSDSYQQWAEEFLKPVIKMGLDHLTDDGVSCWNVGKVRGNDMNVDVYKYHTMFDWDKHEVLSVQSSKRQTNQATVTKNQKSTDDTVVFKKK